MYPFCGSNTCQYPDASLVRNVSTTFPTMRSTGMRCTSSRAQEAVALGVVARRPRRWRRAAPAGRRAASGRRRPSSPRGRLRHRARAGSPAPSRRRRRDCAASAAPSRGDRRTPPLRPRSRRVLQSSTTKMRSTKAGMVRTTPPMCSASSCAGTTTWTTRSWYTWCGPAGLSRAGILRRRGPRAWDATRIGAAGARASRRRPRARCR